MAAFSFASIALQPLYGTVFLEMIEGQVRGRPLIRLTPLGTFPHRGKANAGGVPPPCFYL